MGARGQLIYDNGAPDLLNGFEITNDIVAEDFVVNTPTRLEGIRFWDLELIGFFEGTIVWQIYSAGDGVNPGSLLFSGTATTVSHVATGRVAAPFIEFVSTFDIAPVSLPPGVYCIGLHNGPLSNTAPVYAQRNVFWETTSHVGTRPSRSDVAPFLGLWASNGSPAELAFQLSGVPEPAVTAFGFTDRPRVTFSTIAGRNYRVEFANNLAGSWTPLPGAEMVAGTGSVIVVSDSDPNMTAMVQRFYRVLLL